MRGAASWTRVRGNTKGQPDYRLPLMAQEEGAARRTCGPGATDRINYRSVRRCAACGRLPACAPERASSSPLDFSVTQHDLRGLRHGGRGRNLGVGVVGSDQLGCGRNLNSKPTAGISLSARGFFRLTMKSAILASLASWVTATLITEAVASITIPGTGVT